MSEIEQKAIDLWRKKHLSESFTDQDEYQLRFYLFKLALLYGDDVAYDEDPLTFHQSPREIQEED